MSALFKKIFGSTSSRKIKSLEKTVYTINQFEKELVSISNEDLAKKTLDFKDRINQKKENIENILPEAFSVVRETSKRTLGMRHFDVQLMGGIILHEGKIAEMKTGEGKTLVATLAAYLNALKGNGVHIVTVNDYLAKRDAEWMGKIFKFLGLTVGYVISSTESENRKKAYAADITYTTNNDLVFDYLRDNLKTSLDEIFIKELDFAIVDEVDNIFIDEARTPLAISSMSEQSTDLYPKINRLINFLDNIHFDKDEEKRTILLNNTGIDKVEELLKNEKLLTKGTLHDIENTALNHHITQALRAKHLFQKDKEYVVKDGQIIIVDELSGRMMTGRRYGDGLHQAIEAKENLVVQKESQTIASTTYQNFFRNYNKLSGMTGTAVTEKEEFEKIYNLEVFEVPTNLKLIRVDHDDEIYRTRKEKMNNVVSLVKKNHDKLQPTLIGTTSVENSEFISHELKRNNIKHNVLNAKVHDKEAEIIAQAGKPGAVTISTNMAGRGTDIQLGGNLQLMIDDCINNKNNETEIQNIKDQQKKDKEIVKKAGGLFILGTERHESRRVDNQLRGRSGRQGDEGESKFFLSLEDDLMRIFGSEKLDGILSTLGVKTDEPIQHNLITKALERAQRKVESHNFDMRRQILKFDDILNEQRKIIYSNRKEILANDDHSLTISDMVGEIVDDIVLEFMPADSYIDKWDHEGMLKKCQYIFDIDLPIQNWMNEEGIANEEIKLRILDQVNQKYNEKKNLYSNEMMKIAEKRIMLGQIDMDWRDHLQAMDNLKSSVGLRAIGGKDPFNEYKQESFNYFDEMLSNQNEKVIRTLFRIEIISHNRDEKQRIVNESVTQAKKDSLYKKIPRNAQCPCGSGKKYKHCHGK
ncbi:MAG: preprotein translocase subunit SecA [Pelagibacteraceae bacterium]|nr:preprotein translocase subunit SecA [Pelagibacteraceae bacterium]